jgi:hypothetical protein
LNDLKNIYTNINTKEKKISILKNGILKNKILFSLPINDITEFNRKISKAVLEVLFIVINNLFTRSSTEDETKQFELLFEEANSYNILLFFLNIYKNDEQKELIAIILARFYSYIKIPEEGKIIINILINSLKRNIKNKLTEISINKHIERVLDVLSNISFNKENRNLFIDKEITPLLFSLINSSEINIYKDSIILLNWICFHSSDEEKNNFIKFGIFDVFHKKLLEILPPPPGKILTQNYYSIWEIIYGINNILNSNSFGVSSFLNTPLIPLLLQILDSVLTLTILSSDENIYRIQKYICDCFVNISSFSYNNICKLIELKVIDIMINIIEKHISQTKKKKTIIKEETAELAATVIFNTTVLGSNKALISENNKFKKIFEEENKLKRLFEIFKFLDSLQSISQLQKEMMNHISISICFLFKKERPPLSYSIVFSYIDKLRSSPHPTSGYDFPSTAQNGWDEINQN